MQAAVVSMNIFNSSTSYTYDNPANTSSSSTKTSRKHSRSTSTIDAPTITKKPSLINLHESSTTNTPNTTNKNNNDVKLQNITESSKDFICIISPTGAILYSSPSVCKFLGQQPNQLINRSISAYLHSQDITR